MDVTDYPIKKFKRINGYFIYLLELPMEHWAIVLHDRDDETLLKSRFEWDWLSALHTYNEWKDELYEEARKQREESIQDDFDLAEL